MIIKVFGCSQVHHLFSLVMYDLSLSYFRDAQNVSFLKSINFSES